jgi:hypothetical protein
MFEAVFSGGRRLWAGPLPGGKRRVFLAGAVGID